MLPAWQRRATNHEGCEIAGVGGANYSSSSAIFIDASLRWPILRMLIIKIKAKCGMLVGPGYPHGNNFSLALLFEEWIHHFQQDCFGPAGGI
jgi:hypothetical protein